MSSIINKMKGTIHDKKHAHSEPEGTHGPHNSRIANAADPRVDSDRDGSHRMGEPDTYGGYTHSDNYTTGGGSYKHDTHFDDGPAPHTAGPHRSDIQNKADPRVDSDRDGSRNMGMSTGPAPHTAGPHKSDAFNKADPRVDSDRDGSRNMGMSQPGTYTGTMGTHHTAGPHRSDVMNKADPRVDSDLDGSRNAGLNRQQHHGMTGGGMTGSSVPEGTYGPHSTRTGNVLDPRVDSDRDGSNTMGDSRFGGPAPHTSGPHKSDMMNKADPRVDSDLDGSKTFGRDKTYTQSNAPHDQHGQGLNGKNPLDASQVPPSVFRKHAGEVEIVHGDHAHNRERRNSVATPQENHMMGNVA